MSAPNDFADQLSTLIAQGMTFPDCVRAFGVDTETNDYAKRGVAFYQKDGEVEIDNPTVLSESNEGAYVMAWVWVDKERDSEVEDS